MQLLQGSWETLIHITLYCLSSILFFSLIWNSVIFLILSALQVEFPDARIYEETLNILLYENRTGPDQELMQATSTRVVVPGMSSYASDDEEERSGLARLRSNKQNNP